MHSCVALSPTHSIINNNGISCQIHLPRIAALKVIWTTNYLSCIPWEKWCLSYSLTACAINSNVNFLFASCWTWCKVSLEKRFKGGGMALLLMTSQLLLQDKSCSATPHPIPPWLHHGRGIERVLCLYLLPEGFGGQEGGEMQSE